MYLNSATLTLLDFFESVFKINSTLDRKFNKEVLSKTKYVESDFDYLIEQPIIFLVSLAYLQLSLPNRKILHLGIYL